MNAPLPPGAPVAHKFTLDEARRAWASGVFADYPDMELIDGELIEMPADGPRTIDWNERINRHLSRTLPEALRVVPDKTLALPPYGGPQPDFYIHDRASAAEVDGRNVLLVIEVSDTTLDYDLGVKARLYAQGGVREYWVVDCEGKRILIHRLDHAGHYGEPVPADFGESVQAAHAPGVSLRLSELGLP
jgi:Uma2 family endonuclease